MPKTIPEEEARRFLPELWTQNMIDEFERGSILNGLVPPPPQISWYRRIFYRWRYRFGVLRDAWRTIREDW
jgi:hypothetical protein